MKTAFQKQSVPHRHAVPTILCIDDDPEVSGAIERRLSRYNVHFIRAFHGMHGYAEALTHRPDVILMDLKMPNGDGVTILECLRRNQQTAAIPVIVLTGMRDRRLKHRLLNLGAEAYLCKPLLLDDLTRTLGHFVELHERKAETA